MSDIAIKVENLGKSYLVGHNADQAEHYTALRDVIARNTKNLARKTREMLQGKAIVQGDEVEEFWALKDINFEIKQGDRVGIIGRNGAGKSTLLKILSRITEPTTGRVSINGRVASLLEVGTGFHPELTGRENIFLNGAILGMSRKEIQRKFDEIVDFAEVERFLDTPVKRYSSGMYVRLAFAVAAHLEPEILIVDEVLAVGDAEFQKKCLGKMDEISDTGRTVIFVSHNLSSIIQLTSTCIYLMNGCIKKIDKTNSVISEYTSVASLKSEDGYLYKNEAKENGVLSIKIESENHEHISQMENGKGYVFKFRVISKRIINRPIFSFQLINNTTGHPVIHAWNFDIKFKINPNTIYELKCIFPKLKASLGNYSISTFFNDYSTSESIESLQCVGSVNICMPTDRDLYPWAENSMTYLEDFSWENIK